MTPFGNTPPSSSKKKKNIAVICIGGNISTYFDTKTHAVFRTETKENILPFLSKYDIPCSWKVYSEVIERSSFLDMSDWEQLYEFIKKRFWSYDGFVILHETDSIIFASSLFAYLFSKCAKPLIFTCSPIPLGDSASDDSSEQNIVGAIHGACSDIGESCIFSNGKVFRATRVKRQNIMEKCPFYSYQTDILGDITPSKTQLYLHRKHRDGSLIQFHDHFPKKNVFFMRMIPSDQGKTLQYLRETPDAIVIQTLGYTFLPNSIISILENFSKIGVRIVILSEHDSQNREFHLGSNIQQVPGVVVLKNMIVWSCLAKTHIALANTTSRKEFHAFMHAPLAGDIVE